jgi:hypothetical protein
MDTSLGVLVGFLLLFFFFFFFLSFSLSLFLSLSLFVVCWVYRLNIIHMEGHIMDSDNISTTPPPASLESRTNKKKKKERKKERKKEKRQRTTLSWHFEPTASIWARLARQISRRGVNRVQSQRLRVGEGVGVGRPLTMYVYTHMDRYIVSTCRFAGSVSVHCGNRTCDRHLRPKTRRYFGRKGAFQPGISLWWRVEALDVGRTWPGLKRVEACG